MKTGMWLRVLVAAVFSIAIGAAVASDGHSPKNGTPTSAAASGPLLALAAEGSQSVLIAVDPRSLRPLPGSCCLVVTSVDGWARAPGGAPVAIVSGRGSRLRFVDPERMRVMTTIATGARGVVALASWPRRDRLWLVLAEPGCCARGTTTVVAVDPLRRRVVARTRLAAGLTRVAATPEGPVLLLAPPGRLGAARLTTVDARGHVRDMTLEGFSAGRQPSDGVVSVLRSRQPGLAVDPATRRAYVMSRRSQVVEVDLRERRIDHHRLSPRRSLGERLRELFEARAEARPIIGPERSAVWLPPRYIAVSGRDSRVGWSPGGALAEASRPSGLQVIDSRNWTVRTVDPLAQRFHVANGFLLQAGSAGLAAYWPDGSSAFRLLAGRRVEVVGAAGALAYVRVDGATSLTVVDLARRRVLASGPDPSPMPLADQVGGAWR